jgi:hypothetical protein
MSTSETSQPAGTSGKQVMFRLFLFIVGLIGFVIIVKYFLG